ncbi:MAG TPA: TIGR02594 family protein [Polyangia bacterium]|nr:TIGR02594 family protein [Polyangia bacterium]
MHPNLSVLPGVDLSPYPWMKPALQEYGTSRVAGHPDANPRVIEYLRVVGLPRKGKDDDESWCSAFVNWCMKQLNIRGSMGGLARGWLRWGQAIGQPVFGCIVVLKRDPDPRKGHVGFFVGRDGSDVMLLGGNQTLTEHRVKIRSLVCVATYDGDRVLGYRWPADRPLPKDPSAPPALFPLLNN